MLCLILALIGLSSAALRTAPSKGAVARLRDIKLPEEITLESAKRLHADFKARSRAMERLHGHVHAKPAAPPPPPPPPGPPTPANNTNPIIYPTNFGADPTGTVDSTDAFNKAMAALLKGGARHVMAEGIHDLGGATLDLAGGQYIINAPLVIPLFFGNVFIMRGTLRAGPSFPKDKFLIMVGDNSCNPPSGQGSCNEYVNVIDMLLDCSHTAAGAVYIGMYVFVVTHR